MEPVGGMSMQESIGGRTVFWIVLPYFNHKMWFKFIDCLGGWEPHDIAVLR